MVSTAVHRPILASGAFLEDLGRRRRVTRLRNWCRIWALMLQMSRVTAEQAQRQRSTDCARQLFCQPAIIGWRAVRTVVRLGTTCLDEVREGEAPLTGSTFTETSQTTKLAIVMAKPC